MGDEAEVRAELARRLQTKIATEGLKLRQVAAATGINLNRVHRALHPGNGADIGLDALIALCRWLGVGLADVDPKRPEKPSWHGVESDLRALGLREEAVAICRAVYIAEQGR